MEPMDKLRMLLPHWIEHNLGHEEECRKWAAIAREQGLAETAEHIDEAITAMQKANEKLTAALQEAGGSVQEGGSGHHHHHHHHRH